MGIISFYGETESHLVNAVDTENIIYKLYHVIVWEYNVIIHILNKAALNIYALLFALRRNAEWEVRVKQSVYINYMSP